MPAAETLEDFYKKKFNWLPANLKQDIGHFNVFDLTNCVGPNGEPPKYSRRDYYKVTLIRGHALYHYAEKSIEIDGTTLIFFNPQVPYTWQPLSDGTTGYFCIFREGFFSDAMRGNFH